MIPKDISNSLLKTALDNINSMICIVDENSVVRFWNSEAVRFYNVAGDEIIGRPVTEFFPSALIPRVLKEKKAYEDVYNSPKKGCYIVISAFPLYDDQHRLIGGISIDRDITDYFETKALLEKTSDNLKLLEEEINAINQSQYAFSRIIGQNPAFIKAIKLCKDVSDSGINILLLGESGTGKEVVARGIHAESKRKGPFIPLNCSAIPKDLFESELFGYEAGAFTGAKKKGKIGKMEAADQGTLFLDEIGELPMALQPKLLRVLETNTLCRLGGNKELSLDVRVIAATNKDLKTMVEKGTFRQDLYYRLNSVAILLPSLRERKEDIALFINHFIEMFSMEYGLNIPVIKKGFLRPLVNYNWEGNIRELKNVIERVIILHKKQAKKSLNADDIPDYIDVSLPASNPIKADINDLGLAKRMERVEKETILEALKMTKGQITQTAELLKIPRTSLYYKLKKHQISFTKRPLIL